MFLFGYSLIWYLYDCYDSNIIYLFLSKLMSLQVSVAMTSLCIQRLEQRLSWQMPTLYMRLSLQREPSHPLCLYATDRLAQPPHSPPVKSLLRTSIVTAFLFCLSYIMNQMIPGGYVISRWILLSVSVICIRYTVYLYLDLSQNKRLWSLYC